MLGPRQQGDLGEFSAIQWLVCHRHARVYLPFQHSPDVDLVADLDGHLVRVQVKTTSFFRAGRWNAMVATRGGNQSWNRVVKHFSADRCDRLFVHAGDGRRWFVPSERVDATTSLNLGGPKYAEWEVEPWLPLEEITMPAR